MSEPFIGEIKLVGFSFAPRNWALCDGSLLPISNFSALFSLLGTTYGGDGFSTFRLPDLRGRAPIGQGSGPSLPTRAWGQKGGDNTMPITTQNMPSHNHGLLVSNETGNVAEPGGSYISKSNDGENNFHTAAGASPTTAISTSVQDNGAGTPLDITNPYLAMYYVIALTGIFPSQS